MRLRFYIILLLYRICVYHTWFTTKYCNWYMYVSTCIHTYLHANMYINCAEPSFAKSIT